MQHAEEDVLHAIAKRFNTWLMDAALPLWWERGADHVRGGFFEALDQDGKPVSAPRRARVQARQSWVYALGGAMGWNGPWQDAAEQGLAYLDAKYRRPDGQISTLVSEKGDVLDTTAMLYDQTFILLAMAQFHKVFPARKELAEQARAYLNVLITAKGHSGGGFREPAGQPFQSNPHMHLLEAALAWCEIDTGGPWDRLADEIVELCLSHFIDRDRGFIGEYFDSGWAPLAEAAGNHVEPGHQFEWAWLLERWGRLREHEGAKRAAKTLFAIGTLGADPRRGVAVDEMSSDLIITRPTARLWNQAERIKAAIALSDACEGAEKADYRAQAIAASDALWRYLETPITGLWWDRMTAEGNFVEEPAPASSFYHIICCISVLRTGVRS